MSAPIIISPPAPPRRRPVLQRVGDAMQRHARLIRIVQWSVVLFYLVLVVTPAFLPAPEQGATLFNNLTLCAQFLFWGIWWPFVILSMLACGRVWCGVFCPEGALTEFASRHGLGKAIPRWMRWSGWPVVSFIVTTVYGQLVSVYEYPKAALLVLGGSTVAAMLVGFVYGKGKRVWCRYLCPASGVFGLLAKIAPVHFAADAQAWQQFQGRPPRINCAPLLDLRHLDSASKCHSCGRCSGYRNAIALTWRSPNQEILNAPPRSITTAEAMLLIFGLLGVSIGAFQWSASPWFIAIKNLSANFLIEHEWFLLLQDNAPWWLLTNYPAAADVFTWLDGLCILAYIGGTALVLGSFTLLCLLGATRIASDIDWRHLAMGLVPIAGLGVFLGLSMMTLTQLRAEGVQFDWLPAVRITLLAAGIAWSGWLGWRQLDAGARTRLRRFAAMLLYVFPVAMVALTWVLLFFVW